MQSKELALDKFITSWFSSRNAREETRKAYLQGMQAFTEFTKKTPEELILEAEQEIRVGALLRERQLYNYIPDFRSLLESQGLAPLTVKGRLAAVRSFYENYNIPIPALPRSTAKAKPEQKRKKLPTKEELQEVLKVCNPLEQALILVGACSGLSAVDLCNLKVKTFKEGFDPKTGITTLHVKRIKTDYDFYTFLTVEATKAVQRYLDYRNRTGDKNIDAKRRRQLSKQYELKEDKKGIGYLFIVQSVSDEYLKTRDEELRKISQQGLLGIYRRINEKAQKSAPKGEYNVLRSHNLRRWFNSQLLNNGAQLWEADYLLGHEIDATHEAYLRVDEASLKATYMRFIPYLTIEKELDITVSREFQDIVQENRDLKTEIGRVTVERSELQNLKKEVEELRKAQKEKEELESVLSDIVAGEFSELNRHKDWEAKYAEHKKRMKTDPVYRKKYLEFELPFIQEVFGNGLGKELEEQNKKDREEHKKLKDAENKLYDALTGTKTLADSL